MRFKHSVCVATYVFDWFCYVSSNSWDRVYMLCFIWSKPTENNNMLCQKPKDQKDGF